MLTFLLSFFSLTALSTFSLQMELNWPNSVVRESQPYRPWLFSIPIKIGSLRALPRANYVYGCETLDQVTTESTVLASNKSVAYQCHNKQSETSGLLKICSSTNHGIFKRGCILLPEKDTLQSINTHPMSYNHPSGNQREFAIMSLAPRSSHLKAASVNVQIRFIVFIQSFRLPRITTTQATSPASSFKGVQ